MLKELPSPDALTPFTVATMSSPVARAALRPPANVPEVPSLMTSISTNALEPYSDALNVKVPFEWLVVTPIESETRLTAALRSTSGGLFIDGVG